MHSFYIVSIVIFILGVSVFLLGCLPDNNNIKNSNNNSQNDDKILQRGEYGIKPNDWINFYFQVNSADHSVNHYHIMFHTFFILAITVASNTKKNPAIFVKGLAILGAISALLSCLTFYRSRKHVEFWRNKMPKKLKDESDEERSKHLYFIKDARYISMIILFVIYVLIIFMYDFI